MAIGTEPIPMPPGLPVLGHIFSLDTDKPLQSMEKMADEYGPIYRLNFGHRTVVAVSTHALVNECCDESRFRKQIGAALREVRSAVHDGLFTAYHTEPNWGKAHRVLTPAFGPMPIRGMFDEMYDIASQLALKWARHGPNEPIMVTDDFTRLALDTLALCAMDYRFNSFYRDTMHPFVESMGRFLKESGTRTRRPPLPQFLYRAVDEQYAHDIEVMQSTADGVVKERRKQQPPSKRRDLLAAMLEGKDPKTGAKLDDRSISDNLITFLIAGHETTSGMLSFALLRLMQNPEIYRKAQEEVDTVVGRDHPVTVDHVTKLPYIAAILRETLRVDSPIAAIAVTAINDEVLGGKYFVPAGEDVLLMLRKAHWDKAVFGDDALEFKPERMLDDNFERLNREFPNCWKPFGNGMRACIGRPFAWQEAQLVMAMLLQNFDFELVDANYEKEIKETLTFKPKDLYMHAKLREGLTPTLLEQHLAGGLGKKTKKQAANGSNGHVAAANNGNSNSNSKATPLHIYYGSNSGTCEAMAQRVAADAAAHGFRAQVLAGLDDAVSAGAKQPLPTDGPVVIVTASYEGEPPDNAETFVSWLQSEQKRSDEGLSNVEYAVFGCGNHDWAKTFHRVPRLVDRVLADCGATRVAALGLTDVAEGNMFEDFEAWEDDVLFPALQAKYGSPDDGGEGKEAESLGLDLALSTPRAATLRQDVAPATALAADVLTTSDALVEKRRLVVQLDPATSGSGSTSGSTSPTKYRAGDYLVVLPVNPTDVVVRALRRFHLPWDVTVTLVSPSSHGASAVSTTAAVPPSLPLDIPTPAWSLLSNYVELGQPATKRSIQTLIDASSNEATKTELRRLAGDAYAVDISAKRVSVLDLLEAFEDIALSFSVFLELLPPMRIRQYSISSSPLVDPTKVTLTYSVLKGPARSGQGQFHGVATSYLASLAAGDTVHVAVRSSPVAFHLPDDDDDTPVVFIGAGTGLAPFRGFIEERAAQAAAGKTLPPALLFFGCRSAADDLYRDELDRWEQDGLVRVFRAFSRDANQPSAAGCRYVQDRLVREWAHVAALWNQGAKLYLCGSRQMAEGVKQTLVRQFNEQRSADDGQAESLSTTQEWFDSLRNIRHAADVFD